MTWSDTADQEEEAERGMNQLKQSKDSGNQEKDGCLHESGHSSSAAPNARSTCRQTNEDN